MAHATVLTRLTGTPSSSARSLFSDDARSAMPIRLRLRNSMRPKVSSSTRAKAKTWLPVRIGSPRELCSWRPCHGVATFGTALAFSPNQIGMKKPSAAKLCAMPIETTVTMSREACLNRRSTTISVNAPVSSPPTTAIGRVSR